MENQLEELFQTRKNKTISLEELESHVSGSSEYKHFANVILSFEENGVLTRIKSHGETGRVPSLAYTYRINKSILRQSHHNNLKSARLMFHPSIRLEAYFHLSVEEWERSFPYIEKVNRYIEQQGFPQEEVPAPERSFEIVGNEKWITEEGGYELLERIDIWDKLLIIPVSDPIMFAINPLTTQETHHKHLIVENKTTYQGLLPALQESHFTTLIYGSGKKIIKSMEQFSYQVPLPGTHEFFYFGDLDHEGISIWFSLSKKI